MVKKSGSTAILEDAHPDAAVLVSPVQEEHALRAQFHRLRILGGAFAVAVVIATIMIALYGDGVTIQTFHKGDKTDDDIKELIDNYNSISGSLGSLVAKPVEMFLGLFVSAAFLCLATDFTLGKASIGHWQYIPMLAAAAIAYLFSNGLNALNVQVVTGTLHPRISVKDLALEFDLFDLPIAANGSLDAPWNATLVESLPDNSIVNTILHSKLFPLQYINSPCNGTGYSDVMEPLMSMPVVSFGFPSREWHAETMIQAVEPTTSLLIRMNTSLDALPADAALPSSENVTEGLVNMASRVLDDLKLAESYADNFSFVEMDASDTFVRAAHATWLGMFNRTPQAIVQDATVEYMRFDFSDALTMDAVTFEFPVPVVQRDRFDGLVAKVDNYSQLAVGDYCSREGCILPPPLVQRNNRSTTIQSRVQVTSICVKSDGTEDTEFIMPPCAQASTTSLRVVSIGMRTIGDEWDLTAGEKGEPVMRFKNLRTVYSITVGRLAWATEDVATALGADCDVDARAGGCDGLQFAIDPFVDESESDYLVVGTASLPIQALNAYASTGADKWVYLVTTGDGLGEQRFDVLRARHFATVTPAGVSLQTTSIDACNSYTDDYMRAVERNHLYMDHSLQASYTAAFYYLFETAVRVRREPLRATVTSAAGAAGGGATTATKKTKKAKDGDAEPLLLTFAGNLQDMNVQVSVPALNAVVSLVGCLVLLAATAGIAMRTKKSERELQARASAELVAEAMMDSSKYPPWLLEIALRHAQAQAGAAGAYASVATDEQITHTSLQDLRVQSLVLQHSDDPSHVFSVGPDPYKA